MCCTGCLSDVTKALEKIPGIKVRQKDLESQESADMEATNKPKDYGNEVDDSTDDTNAVSSATTNAPAGTGATP